MSLPALSRPVLQNPLAFTLPAAGYADLDAITINVPLGRDAIIRSPRRKRVGHLIIRGGRNIVLAGGHFTIGRNRNGTYPDAGARGVGDTNVNIQNGDAGGIVHLEGLLIDASGGAESDGFMLNCDTRIVQLLNCRVEGLLGSIETGHRHADVLQIGPGGVGELRLDHFTGRSHYNSLYARRENSPLGKTYKALKLRCVNMGGYKTNPIGAPQQTLTGLSLGTQPADTDGGPGNNASATNGILPGDVFLENYYAAYAEAGRPNLGQFLHPDARKNSYAAAMPVPDTSGGWYWPLWRGTTPGVRGHVIGGAPPGGDYAPAASVGLAYAQALWA